MVPGTDAAPSTCDNFWCLLQHVYDKQGALVLLFAALAFLFYKMIWKVWSKSMDSKDAEIERLVTERNFYQEMVFQKRLTSDIEVRRDEEDQE